jgi:hypothetical protein
VLLGAVTVRVAAAVLVEFKETLYLSRLAVSPYDDEVVRVIVPLKCKMLLSEMVDSAEPPTLRVRDCGLALMLKSGATTLTKMYAV